MLIERWKWPWLLRLDLEDLWMLLRVPKRTPFKSDIILVSPSCHIATHRMDGWNEGAKRPAWQPVTCLRVFVANTSSSWQQPRAWGSPFFSGASLTRCAGTMEVEP